ncbi:hypothetical protein [Algirhabdus cladophorae]|uniref:hypothetical protein n=1 Tax=Algirhabdus cladophorae TaxID=3377108 RepID=UPI003B845D41
MADLDTAQQLRRDAVAFVETHLGPFRKQPRVLFCSTDACFKNFSPHPFAGLNLGTYGAIVNHTGWTPHIVRHELIHHWQNEQFGVLQASILHPQWFREGMAYSLSQDPRKPIPHAPSQNHRTQFETWVAQGNNWRDPPAN